MLEAQEPKSLKEATAIEQPPQQLLIHSRGKWWLFVALNSVFLLVGQAAATLLGGFYFDQGGKSKWMATLVQSAAFPILLIPLFFFHSSSPQPDPYSTTITPPSLALLTLVYSSLGLLLAGDNFLYSVGFAYLPISTYSLICATQLAFNAIFSFFINSHKFTALILNSAVLLSLSATLLASGADSGEPKRISKEKYVVGFICTLAASAMYSLLLSLMQLSFEKVLRKETFSVVLEMQIYISFVATCACVVGLFASGEWSGLSGEMEGFKKGRVIYIMTLVWSAVAWQICSVGIVGLVFLVSSLFSNVISTLSFPLAPLLAVIAFHDKMDGVKVVAMLLAMWGLASYFYQHYLDDSKPKEKLTDLVKDPDASAF